MHNLLTLALALLICLGAVGQALAADGVPIVMAGGGEEKIIGYGQNIAGRIYLPLRSVGEHCGAKVVYDPTREAVLVNRADGGYLELSTAGSGNEALFRQGVTYVPLRWLGEWLNYQVDYHSGQVRLGKLSAAPQADTLALSAANPNCNMLNNKYGIFWQGDIYYWQSLSDSLNRVNGRERQTEVARGSYHSFNIRQDELYAVYDGQEPYSGYSFYKLNTETFLPQEKILAGPLWYCKIQDDWIYFQRQEYGEVYRRRLAGGAEENLGLNNAAEIIITDQHIFATVKTPEFCQLWQAELDGSHPKLLTALCGRSAKLLDYADGNLYLTLDSEDKAAIWRMRQDGAEFKQLSSDGADEACVLGDALYYSRIECEGADGTLTSYGGCSIWRIPLAGGAEEQVSPAATEMWSGYDQPVIWNGRVFYREFAMLDFSYWHEVKQNAD